MRPLMREFGMGLSTFSPTAGGLLSGDVRPKHAHPSNLEGKQEVYEIAQRCLVPIAKELGCTAAQLAIAWCAKNTDVAVCVFGTSKPARIAEQVRALALVPKLTPAIMERLDELCGTKPTPRSINGGHRYR